MVRISTRAVKIQTGRDSVDAAEPGRTTFNALQNRVVVRKGDGRFDSFPSPPRSERSVPLIGSSRRRVGAARDRTAPTVRSRLGGVLGGSPPAGGSPWRSPPAECSPYTLPAPRSARDRRGTARGWRRPVPDCRENPP